MPGHGTPSQNGAYLAGKYIEYLTELQELAAEAVAAGMNLTQAMAHVVQPDYQTYTLYGWVQPSINVPFAFMEAGGKIANGEMTAVPSKAGMYKVTVMVNGQHVPGSPFNVKVKSTRAHGPACTASGTGLSKAVTDEP